MNLKNKEPLRKLLRQKSFLIFLFLEIFLITFIVKSLIELYRLSLSQETYSYIILIPIVSAYLFFFKRKDIFSNVKISFVPGILFCFAGILLYVVDKNFPIILNLNDHLSIVVLSWLLITIGLFIICFGWSSFKKASFPFSFLFLMVPIPSFFLCKYAELLRKGSEEVSYFIFRLLGVPVFKLNNIFQLPNFTIEVAKECSGIRSSIGLWITAILSGYFLLKTNKYRFLLLVSVIPITIFKNGLRIVTLGLLASYVDPIYVTDHWLHKSGGILYFIIALIFLFFPWLYFLKAHEEKANKKMLMSAKYHEKLQ